MENFFQPKSIAVIGASRNRQKIGYKILNNLISEGFLGKVFPVNPKTSKVLGLSCYASVLKIPSKIDLALIVVPAAIVPHVLEEVGQKGIKQVVIISAGFAEIGGSGMRLEKKIISICQKYSLQLLGPNCMGLINTAYGLNLSFGPKFFKKGSLSILSQSGALGSVLLDFAQEKDLGVAKFISLGNKTNLDESDFLEYLLKDPQTKSILIYLEDIRRPQRLTQVLEKNRAGKPIIVMTAGLTSTGRKITFSHTGALSQDPVLKLNFLQQKGMRAIHQTRDLFALLEKLAKNKIPKLGARSLIITNGGGPAALLGDLISQNENLVLAPLTDNPVDLLGAATPDDYEREIKKAISNKLIETIFVIVTPQIMTQPDKIAEKIIQNFDKKPIISILMGGQKTKKGWRLLEKAGLPFFTNLDEAVLFADLLVGFRDVSETSSQARISRAKKKKIQKLLQADRIDSFFDVFQELGFQVEKPLTFRSLNELKKNKIKFPVALKTAVSLSAHKAKAGGVILGISGFKELKKEYKILSKKFGSLAQIQKMIFSDTNLFFGAKKDRFWGDYVLFGTGGTRVEMIGDVVGLIPPFKKRSLEKNIKKTKISSALSVEVLKQVRSLIVASAWLIREFPEILEIDLNPVKLVDNKLKIVDVRIIKNS